MEEAAHITGYTATWLRELNRRGYFPKTADGRVNLQHVIRGIERSIFKWPAGF